MHVDEFLDLFVDLLVCVCGGLTQETLPLLLPACSIGEFTPGPGQEAHGNGAPGDPTHSKFGACRVHFPFLLTIDSVVEILHRYKLRPPMYASSILVLKELMSPHRRSTNIAHPARLHDFMNRLHRFFKGVLGSKRWICSKST